MSPISDCKKTLYLWKIDKDMNDQSLKLSYDETFVANDANNCYFKISTVVSTNNMRGPTDKCIDRCSVYFEVDICYCKRFQNSDHDQNYS